ncbi:MAG TPA: hypothetical protein VKA21_16235, partial [Candidatus Binatia bacterium]|nr:hypothetical protein [Candidatus Binatia bacterium]
MRPAFAGLVVLALVSAAPAAPGICVLGTSIGCVDDHDPCTTARCVGATCVQEPASGPACNDRDGCTENDHCEAGRCVGVPVVCRDDGFACTDDVCLAGRCTHVPVDGRCVPPDSCTSAVCDPERAGHDEAGCAGGPTRAEAEECAEDGDACTADVCSGGRCAHPPSTDDRRICTAVQDVFRQAIALEAAARTLLAISGLPRPVRRRLETTDAALSDVARVLAGKTPVASTRRGDGLVDTLLQQ